MGRPHDERPLIPARVETAIQVLHYVNNSKRPGGSCFPAMSGDTPTAEEDLSPGQQKLEAAAIRVLQQYLTGEMDFGDVPPTAARRGDDDAPGVREPRPQPT